MLFFWLRGYAVSWSSYLYCEYVRADTIRFDTIRIDTDTDACLGLHTHIHRCVFVGMLSPWVRPGCETGAMVLLAVMRPPDPDRDASMRRCIAGSG